ncbi:MAG: SCO1664 family protein [Acidimicrobiales bacterium]
MPTHERQPSTAHLSDEEWITLLRAGAISVEGRMPWSSNATLLVRVQWNEHEERAVYKPGRGERELWDFPRRLYKREVAAFELDRALGLGVVPAAVVRRDAPFGEGSLQRFVDARFDEHYFSLRESSAYHDSLREIAAFDLLANNADRKGGHLLVDKTDKLWAIDNALTFHADWKLRTVMWDFAGDAIPEPALTGARRLVDALPEPLCDLLSEDEQDALQARARIVVDNPVFPEPDDETRLPWPLV